MNTAAMSEIEPGNVLQVSTSLSIFTQPLQVCVEQTSAAGCLREQAFGGGRTLAASGWHVLACVRTRRFLARDDAALRATRDAAVRACARTGIVCATQRRLFASVRRAVTLERTARLHGDRDGAPSRSSVRARARTHGSVAVLHRTQRSVICSQASDACTHARTHKATRQLQVVEEVLSIDDAQKKVSGQ